MNITVLTPLFPPDTGAPAPYTKELAKRLADKNITVIAYGRLPEAVRNALIIPIDKRGLKTILIVKCLTQLRKIPTDLLLVNNGPSSELPALIYSFFSTTPIILIESDARAIVSSKSGLYKLLHKALMKRCRKVVTLPGEATYLKPEILPFSTTSQEALEVRNDWWKNHINNLTSL